MGLKGRDIMSIKQWNSSNSIGLDGVALNLGRSRGWVSTIWEGGEGRQYPPLKFSQGHVPIKTISLFNYDIISNFPTD
jgi:hypothetical protein